MNLMVATMVDRRKGRFKLSEGNTALLNGYLTREEFASALGKSARTIDRWDRRRIGPPRVVVGKTILYRVEAVKEWLQSCEQRRGRVRG